MPRRARPASPAPPAASPSCASSSPVAPLAVSPSRHPAVSPSRRPAVSSSPDPQPLTPRCGRWKLKPFEALRPVLLRADGPLSLGQFLEHPDPAVLEEILALDAEGLQQLTLARLEGAPPDRPIALFGEGGYTFADAVRHVEEGTPLGVRIIEAERKLVGLLLTEALWGSEDGGWSDGGTAGRRDSGRRVLASEVDRRLDAAYGPIVQPPPEDPLEELVLTILSQHTSDANSDRAYRQLLATFGSLEAVAEAPVEAIEQAIRSGGLARVKALRIAAILERLLELRGELRLDFLRDLDLAAGRAFLMALDGVGPKTAACVLLFACGKPAIPVDTHVHRVSHRLGLIGPRASAEAAHTELEGLVPPERAYAFHVGLIRHGREVCKAQVPRCSRCALQDLCPRVGVTRSA